MNQLVRPGDAPQANSATPYKEAVAHDSNADMLDFRAGWDMVLQAVRYRWRMILGVLAATLVILLTYIIVWPATYQAHVTLIAAAEQDPDRDNFYSTWAVFRRNAVQDEVLLFGSGPVLAEVIEKENLTYDDVYHPPLRYAVHLWTVSPPGKAWRAFKEFVFGKSPYALTPEEIDYAKTIDDFRQGVGVEQVGNSNVGLLVVRASTPRVHEIANRVAETYLRQRREVFAQEARDAYDSLKVETEKAFAELTGIEQQMERYYTDNDMLLMFEKDKVEIAQYLAARDQQMAVNRELTAMRSELTQVNRIAENEPEEVLSARQVQRSPVYASYEQQLGQLEIQRELLSLNYLETSPEIVDVDRQIEALKTQMAKTEAERTEVSNVVRSTAFETLASRKRELQVGIASKTAEYNKLRSQVGSMARNIAEIPEMMQESHNLGREHQALEKRYLLLQEKLMTAEVSAATAASAPSTFRIVEPAIPPEKPVSPRTRLLLLAGVVLGLAMGIVFAILLDYFTGKVSASRLLKRRGSAPLYAIVRSPNGEAARMLIPA